MKHASTEWYVRFIRYSFKLNARTNGPGKHQREADFGRLGGHFFVTHGGPVPFSNWLVFLLLENTKFTKFHLLQRSKYN